MLLAECFFVSLRKIKPTKMDILLAILAFVLSIVGLIGCIVPIIPGIVMNFIALALISVTDYAEIGVGALGVWFAVTIVVTVADLYLPVWMTRKFGGSRAGEVGATVGILAGMFLFPPYGVILGPFFGAVLGELSRDKKDVDRALKSGVGSFLAFIVGTGLKLFVGMWMMWVIISTCYAPVKAWILSFF